MKAKELMKWRQKTGTFENICFGEMSAVAPA